MDSKEIVGVGPLTEQYLPKPLILSSMKILFGKKRRLFFFFLMKVVKNLLQENGKLNLLSQ